MRENRLSIGVLLGGMIFLLAGCGASNTESQQITDPAVLFNMHCAKCHAQAGQPGGPPGIGSSKGPNLTHIGSEPGHTAEYIAKYIRDPKSVNPKSKLMPKFEGVMTDEQIRILAEHLAAKK